MNRFLILTACLTHSICAENHISDFLSIEPTITNTDLKIPSSHHFQKIMDDTELVADNDPIRQIFDFTGYSPINNSSTNGYLTINHENLIGGATVLDVQYDSLKQLWNVSSFQKLDFTAVGGTTKNCSGAITPWNTVISCEEKIIANDLSLVDGHNDQGWCVEIDPAEKKSSR